MPETPDRMRCLNMLLRAMRRLVCSSSPVPSQIDPIRKSRAVTTRGASSAVMSDHHLASGGVDMNAQRLSCDPVAGLVHGDVGDERAEQGGGEIDACVLA